MKFVLAPDSFKESMTALEAAQAMERGIRQVYPDAECELVPMADGGEGTTQALIDALGGHLVHTPAIDPLGRPREAAYGLVADTQGGAGTLAIIEMAAASGLELLTPDERDARITTTFGLGEVLRDALERGARRFVIGIGGSATNDGGSGMLTALGARFLDADDAELPPGGAALADLARIDISGLDPRLAETTIEVACDVDNPLTGERGASAVFGPQKGASPEAVTELDAALEVLRSVTRSTLGADHADHPGAGAAGGLGFALISYLGGRLRRGSELVVDTVGLADRCAGADWVFTGEGGMDYQTRFGKTPYGVAVAAKTHDIPVIAFVGRRSPDADTLADVGIDAIVPILTRACDLSTALAQGAANLETAAASTCRIIALAQR